MQGPWMPRPARGNHPSSRIQSSVEVILPRHNPRTADGTAIGEILFPAAAASLGSIASGSRAVSLWKTFPARPADRIAGFGAPAIMSFLPGAIAADRFAC
jgi:hypothetical protein